jgi:hypothetical protein
MTATIPEVEPQTRRSTLSNAWASPYHPRQETLGGQAASNATAATTVTAAHLERRASLYAGSESGAVQRIVGVEASPRAATGGSVITVAAAPRERESKIERKTRRNSCVPACGRTPCPPGRQEPPLLRIMRLRVQAKPRTPCVNCAPKIATMQTVAAAGHAWSGTGASVREGRAVRLLPRALAACRLPRVVIPSAELRSCARRVWTPAQPLERGMHSRAGRSPPADHDTTSAVAFR